MRSPTATVALAAVETTAALYDEGLFAQYLAQRATLPEEWTRVTAVNSYSLTVTVDELTQLTDAIDALLRRYVRTIRQEPPPASEVVHVSLRAFLNPTSSPPQAGESAAPASPPEGR